MCRVHELTVQYHFHWTTCSIIVSVHLCNGVTRNRAVKRLNHIDSQDTLILLRSSFGAPKVQHLLRCSPSYEHPALQTFDDLHQFGSLWHPMIAGQFTDQGWWSGSEKSVIARTFCHSGFSGEHSISPSPNRWWLSCVRGYCFSISFT